MDPTALIRDMATKARVASRELAKASGAQKNSALTKIADALLAHQSRLLEENAKDLAQAKSDGLAAPLVARLTLPEKKIAAMAQGLREIALQTDPVGQTIEAYDRPNGLRIEKRRVPIGVVAIIFESRPNVTADAGCLCLKSGNAVILRGGSEAFHSNMVLADLMDRALRPEDGALQGSEAGKAIIRQITTEARAQMEQIQQANDMKKTIRNGANHDNR